MKRTSPRRAGPSLVGHAFAIALVFAIALLLPCATPAVARAAGVAPVGVFAGKYQEVFDEFGADSANRSLVLFGGHGSVRVEGDANSIKLEWSSSLGGDLVTPMSGLMMGQLGIADWEFAQPVGRFGAYWENNSHADDATAEFFDAGGSLIESRVVPVSATAQHWVWNGWQFDTPVSRIRVTGNGLINGFIWYENAQIDVAVPEPTSLPVVLIGFSVAATRSRRHWRAPSIRVRR